MFYIPIYKEKNVQCSKLLMNIVEFREIKYSLEIICCYIEFQSTGIKTESFRFPFEIANWIQLLVLL